MDLLTHGLAGALVARSLARPGQARLALGTGFAAALLPDADVLIRSPADPLLAIEFHRHFSHSLLISPLGALLAAWLVWLILRRKVPLLTLYIFAWPAYVSACLLDAATSYGTRLLWPLDDRAWSWNLIAVVDPLFSLFLIAGFALAWWTASALPARLALLLALAWLGLGYVQRERAGEAAAALALSRGHTPVTIEAKPTMGNLLVWRTLYLHEEHFHVDAVRPGFGNLRVYPGSSIERFRPEQLVKLDPGSRLARDIARFTRFSAGKVALHEIDGRLLLGDVRYALRPNDTAPLWGITLALDEQEGAPEFLTFRKVDEETRAAFLAMLRGDQAVD